MSRRIFFEPLVVVIGLPGSYTFVVIAVAFTFERWFWAIFHHVVERTSQKDEYEAQDTESKRRIHVRLHDRDDDPEGPSYCCRKAKDHIQDVQLSVDERPSLCLVVDDAADSQCESQDDYGADDRCASERFEKQDDDRI